MRKEAPGATSYRARTLYLAPEGRFLGITDAHGEHCHLEPATGAVLRCFRTPPVEYPVRLQLSRDARTLVMSKGTGAQTQGVFAFDAYTGALKGSIGDVASDWGLPFALSADESLIAIAGEDRTPRD